MNKGDNAAAGCRRCPEVSPRMDAANEDTFSVVGRPEKRRVKSEGLVEVQREVLPNRNAALNEASGASFPSAVEDSGRTRDSNCCYCLSRRSGQTDACSYGAARLAQIEAGKVRRIAVLDG